MDVEVNLPSGTDPASAELDREPRSAVAVSPAMAIVAIILVAISLRPGIIAVGPILPSIIDKFRLTHAMASLLTSIPDILMGLLALPSPWLARRFGRDRELTPHKAGQPAAQARRQSAGGHCQHRSDGRRGASVPRSFLVPR